MNILYISYWNMGDGLTEATVFPSLRMLRELLPDAKIVFANIQREKLVAGNLGGLRPRHGAKIWLLLTLDSWLANCARQEL